MSDKTQFERSTVATPFFDGHKPIKIYDRLSPLSPDGSRGPSGGYISDDKIREHGGSLLKTPQIATDVPPKPKP
jgi:hypothetical protein